MLILVPIQSISTQLQWKNNELFLFCVFAFESLERTWQYFWPSYVYTWYKIQWNLTSTLSLVFLGFWLSEFLPFPKHVSSGAGMYGEQVYDFRVLKTNNIEFQSFPSSHRRKAKHRVFAAVCLTDTWKRKMLRTYHCDSRKYAKTQSIICFTDSNS